MTSAIDESMKALGGADSDSMQLVRENLERFSEAYD